MYVNVILLELRLHIFQRDLSDTTTFLLLIELGPRGRLIMKNETTSVNLRNRV